MPQLLVIFLSSAVFLASFGIAQAVSEESQDISARCKRQFPFLPPPSSPFLLLRERIRTRKNQDRLVSNQFRPQESNELRTRIHNRLGGLRNITQAAKGCFENDHGYKCCSQQLFSFMGTAFRSPLFERLMARVDQQKLVEKIVELVQNHFDTSFEVVVAPRDFASKNTFRGDLMCKTKTPSGKTVLVYATPIPYSTRSGTLRRLTEKEIQSKHWNANLFRVSELSFLAKRHQRWFH